MYAPGPGLSPPSTAAASLERARAVLRRAERRVGVRHHDQVIELARPSAAPVTELLPEGDLSSGAVVAVRGSASLMIWLLGATQAERWLAVAGWPELSPLAMSEAGVDLARTVVVPELSGDAAVVLGELVDGFEIVVVGEGIQLTPSERRRLGSRARRHGAAVISAQPWEGAAARIVVERVAWRGPDCGRYFLCEATCSAVRYSSVDAGGRRFEVVRRGTALPTVISPASSAGIRMTG